jgi:predicted nuclease with RNAse H fold
VRRTVFVFTGKVRGLRRLLGQEVTETTPATATTGQNRWQSQDRVIQIRFRHANRLQRANQRRVKAKEVEAWGA